MIYIFLADGFEEIEALCPLDILRRAGLEVVTVGIGGKREIIGAHGICVLADIADIDLVLGEPELILLPGGMPGTKNLEASGVVRAAILDAHSRESFIAAICAAPSVLGKMGLLDGVEATCFPGFEQYLVGSTLSEKKVVRDGHFITAKGMGVALEFGLCIVEALLGKEKADEIAAQIQMK